MPVGQMLDFMNPKGREEEPAHRDDPYFIIEEARRTNIFGQEGEQLHLHQGSCKSPAKKFSGLEKRLHWLQVDTRCRVSPLLTFGM